MAKKLITSVKLVANQIASVTWLEEGSVFPKSEAADAVARKINSGEAFFVRTSDNVDVPVKTRLQHGKYYLTAQPDPAVPDALLALSV